MAVYSDYCLGYLEPERPLLNAANDSFQAAEVCISLILVITMEILIHLDGSVSL